MGKDSGDSKLHRRGFFTEGLRNLLRPLADIVESRMEALPEWMDEEEAGPAPGTYAASPPYPASLCAEGGTRILRPPGALPEAEFLERCTGCAECVKACPVSAIRLVYSAEAAKDRKPAIDPAIQACVVCDDLSCMKVCPTGALRILTREEIRMGKAVLRRDVCVRSHGEDCQICVDKCPIGTAALDIPYVGGEVIVKDGCVGCGVCEMYCPTQPRAIVVEAV